MKLSRLKFKALGLGFLGIAVFTTSGQAQGLFPAALEKEDPVQELQSLKNVPVPEPVNLRDFVKDKAAAITLGKALYWDMQVSSSGTVSCASCHFHSGSDTRVKNVISPGLLAGDTRFHLKKPNSIMRAADFPLTKFKFSDKPGFERDSSNKLLRSSNDVVSSEGVPHFRFDKVLEDQEFEAAFLLVDRVFQVNGTNVRAVEPRNTPTVINAIFNFTNFWDGRARNIFNGVNSFGELDEKAVVFVNGSRGLQKTQVRIPDASLASQAVTPPVSDLEMSSRGRTFPHIGKKLLSRRPLALQKVHPNDSTLGTLANPGKGLNTTYAALIKQAFHDRWWNNTDATITFRETADSDHVPDINDARAFPIRSGDPVISDSKDRTRTGEEFSQMEANFSLYFGLAIQLYEATLVSDDSKFDRVMEGREFFDMNEQAGFDIFVGEGRCINCHGGAEFTNHSITNVRQGKTPKPPGYLPSNFIEFMNIARRSNVIYDNGIYNIGVRPAGSNVRGTPGFVANNEDVGRGAPTQIRNPRTGKPYPFSIVRLAKLKAKNLLPPGVAKFVPSLPAGVPHNVGVAVDGSMKASSLRNIELTGPYFHNGDAATLMQVVQFYVRGTNFPKTNAFNLDPDLSPIGSLAGNPVKQRQLVAFLRTLTDERVRNEMAPFDHPELRVTHGSPGNESALKCSSRPDPRHHTSFCDEFLFIPAIGAEGRKAQGLPPLGTFMNLDPFQP